MLITPDRLTHLRVHSTFTLLGSTAPLENVVARAAADGMTALALTDQDALYGAVSFARLCRQAGIRPIIGATLTIAPTQPDRPTSDLVLLARDAAGYRSLCRLTSLLQAQPDREARLDAGLSWDAVAAHADGLSAIDGGRNGRIARRLAYGDADGAQAATQQLRDAFGTQAAIGLELHPGTRRRQTTDLRTVAQSSGIPLVAMQPVYTLHPDQRATLRLLTAIRRNCHLQDVPDSALPDQGDSSIDLHWLPPDALKKRFAEFPDALEHIGRIIDQCGTALPNGDPIWPDLNLPGGVSAEGALSEQAASGLIERYGPQAPDHIHARLRTELTAINQRGYAPLFIIVADIVRFARANDIPVSTRGSVANSLVAYCIGITTVDPIAYDLLFERFLNPARAGLPDIDLDFCSRRRDRVLGYVRATYGREHVALVSTVNTFKLKSAVRAAGKAHGYSEAELKRLAKQAPGSWHPDPRRRARWSKSDILGRFNSPRDRAIVEAALPLVGLPDHLGVHPGGLIITPGPLTDIVPVQWTAKGFLITQFDHEDVERIGLPKLDLLGIRALTVMADSAEWVRAVDPAFALDKIPEPDERTTAILRRGETIGVFQCESTGAQRTLRQLRAATVWDLAVANAFFKPGPATGGMAGAFVRRYRGDEIVRYLHPSLEPILAPTKGVLLFQEQVLRVAREIAGLSWAQADELRRGMSKFNADAIRALQAAFIDGCQTHGSLPRHSAEKLWQQIVPFAGYGFNQGHATAYADVSYRSAYLKAHFPAAFLCARLANGGGYHHPAVYMAEAQRLGIAVRSPHVNHSERRFTLAWEDGRPVLWMGLSWVRDLRRATARAITQARPFRSLRDLMLRVPVQTKELTHLIQCGALDGLGPSRAALLRDAQAQQRAGNVGQLAFDFSSGLDSAEPDTPAQRLAWERAVLGLPVSVHPLAPVDALPPGAVPLAQLAITPPRDVLVAGVRLPGWGSSFIFWDGHTLIDARAPRKGVRPPRSWQPVALQGYWQHDQWGGARLNMTGFQSLADLP